MPKIIARHRSNREMPGQIFVAAHLLSERMAGKAALLVCALFIGALIVSAG